MRDSLKLTNVVSFSSSWAAGLGAVHLDSTSCVVFWADAISPTAPEASWSSGLNGI